jgi:hypothetical protein
MERIETDFIGLDSFDAEKRKTTSFPADDMTSLAHKFTHEKLSRKSTADMRK